MMIPLINHYLYDSHMLRTTSTPRLLRNTSCFYIIIDTTTLRIHGIWNARKTGRQIYIFC